MKMTEMLFPGGLVRIDPEHVWVKLRAWLRADPSRNCSLRYDHQGYLCRLTWDAVGKWDQGGTTARSSLGIADALANALQAAKDRLSE